MIALLFLVIALPIAIQNLPSLCARRALPLATGLFCAWSLSLFHVEWTSCLIGGLEATAVLVGVLDRLVLRRPTRRTVMTMEALAGAMLAAALSHALLASFDVEGSSLWIACAALAILAGATSVSYRRSEFATDW